MRRLRCNRQFGTGLRHQRSESASYLSTARKQGHPLLHMLECVRPSAAEARTAHAAQTPPG